VGVVQGRGGSAESVSARQLDVDRLELQRSVMDRLADLLDQDGWPGHCRQDLQRVVAAAIDLGVATMDSPAPELLQFPEAMLLHARAAARAQVPLEQVLRGYAAGYSAFVECLVRLAEQNPAASASTEVLRPIAAQFDRSVGAVVFAYTEAAPRGDDPAPPYRARLIERLLRGEHVDSTALRYDFGGWHVAVMAPPDEENAEALRALAQRFDVRWLTAELGEEAVTTWFGSGDREKLEGLLSALDATLCGTPVVGGEPSLGFTGWQLTYRQAESIWPYVSHSPPGIHRYGEMGLVAAIAVNPVLARSMQSLYVEPLGSGPEIETVRAYLASGRNASSTAARLGLSRQTVRNRLREAEARLGRSLEECGAEVEIALRLDRLAAGPSDPRRSVNPG